MPNNKLREQIKTGMLESRKRRKGQRVVEKIEYKDTNIERID